MEIGEALDGQEEKKLMMDGMIQETPIIFSQIIFCRRKMIWINVTMLMIFAMKIVEKRIETVITVYLAVLVIVTISRFYAS